LLLISQDFVSKQIADRLNISIFTENNHRKNIYAKLNVNSAIGAINAARKLGIID